MIANNRYSFNVTRFTGIPVDLSGDAHERTAGKIQALPGSDDVHQRRADPSLHPHLRQRHLPVGSQVRSPKDPIAEDHNGWCAARHLVPDQGSRKHNWNLAWMF